MGMRKPRPYFDGTGTFVCPHKIETDQDILLLDGHNAHEQPGEASPSSPSPLACPAHKQQDKQRALDTINDRGGTFQLEISSASPYSPYVIRFPNAAPADAQ